MHNEICLNAQIVEYVWNNGGIRSKDDVKIMSKVIGGVWTLSKYVWRWKGMQLPYKKGYKGHTVKYV